jgi:hypothetical protein
VICRVRKGAQHIGDGWESPVPLRIDLKQRRAVASRNFRDGDLLDMPLVLEPAAPTGGTQVAYPFAFAAIWDQVRLPPVIENRSGRSGPLASHPGPSADAQAAYARRRDAHRERGMGAASGYRDREGGRGNRVRRLRGCNADSRGRPEIRTDPEPSPRITVTADRGIPRGRVSHRPPTTPTRPLCRPLVWASCVGAPGRATSLHPPGNSKASGLVPRRTRRQGRSRGGQTPNSPDPPLRCSLTRR